MATVNKDFRIKSGLIVEGASGTINGNTILTENSADTYILNLVGGVAYITSVGDNLTVTGGRLSLTGVATTGYADGVASTAETNAKNYADGLASNYDPAGAASTAETNAKNYADGLSSNYDAAGAAYSVAGDLSTHISDTSTHGVTGDIVGTTDSQSLSNKKLLGPVYIQSGGGAGGTNNTLDVDNNTGKLKLTSGYALDITGSGAVNIISNNSDIVLNADGSSYVGSVASGNVIATQGYADGAASSAATTAENNAKSYADGLASNYDAAGSAAAAITTANGYTDTAVANLVNGAPALLDTLSELATAIGNDPTYATDVANLISGKQDTLTAGTGIDITSNTISVTANTYDAYGAAGTAETNAKSYADGLASNYDAAGSASTAETNAKSYADGLASNYDAAGSASTAQTNANGYTDTVVGNVLNGTSSHSAVNINNIAKQVANSQLVETIGTATAISFSANEYRTAKLLVKLASGSHTDVTEVLLTLDVSDNIAITEFGNIYTNVSLGDISAVIDGTNVNVVVTTLNVNTTVSVVGTLLV
jgi:antitoxin component YwqK of YwqJK toxin-antitoxin module